MRKIYADTEYNDHQVILGCFVDDDGKRYEIDFRDGRGVDELAVLIAAYADAVWVAYSAMAEMSAFLRFGVDISGMTWADARVEACMITGTHRVFRCDHPGLHDHLTAFGLAVPEDDKGAMRRLILDHNVWDDAQWGQIVRYCWGDVLCLPGLLQAVVDIHGLVGTPWSLDHAVERGEYLRASAILDHRSRGLPVDVELLTSIFRNKAAIRNALAEECNAVYGIDIYRKVSKFKRQLDDGSREVSISYSLSHEGLEAYLRTIPWVRWERTECGRLSLDDRYLDDLCKDHPTLKHFRHTRQMLAQLNNNGLVERIEDGHIKPFSLPFYTVTGRNQPMAAKGFVLNLPPWLRHVIRPKPGMVLIACDWSKQEIGIAAALSGDAALISAFRSADIYLEIAKMAGAVPEDGTKDTHELERQAYKSVQLGLGYGMGEYGLARQLYADLNLGREVAVVTKAQAEAKAAEIMAWHKRTFRAYWRYLYTQAQAAQRHGFTSTVDGWMYFADGDTKMTRLLNFPMQGNGAVMLREAIRMLAETPLDVVCSLHDAIYIQCRADEAEAAIAQLKAIMRKAVAIVIGDEIEIAVDAKIYHAHTGYVDKRGTKTLAMVKDLIIRAESGDTLTTEIILHKSHMNASLN